MRLVFAIAALAISTAVAEAKPVEIAPGWYKDQKIETLPPEGSAYFKVSCPDGQRVVSGGFHNDFSAPNLWVLSSLPLVENALTQGWAVTIVNEDKAPHSIGLWVYVHCEK